MLGKTFVGQRVSNLDTGTPPEPVSRVTLSVDGTSAYTAGDDTGRTVEKRVPWATQAMAESVLERLRGAAYRPFSGEDALLDPAAEIGDGVTAGGVYSVLARADITFDGLYSADIAAPGGDEVEDEYPYKSRAQRQAERELAKVRSQILKTAESITLLVENEVEGLRSEFTVELGGISARVSDAEKGVSELTVTTGEISTKVSDLGDSVSTISQTVGSISLEVVNGDESSTIKLYKDGIAASSQNISFSGMVTFSDLSGSAGTVINGGAINTSTLYLDSLYGNIIYLRDSAGNIGAQFNVGNASSASNRVEMWARAIYLGTNGRGHVYLDSGSASLEVAGGQVQIAGSLIPNASGRYSCGSSGFKWTDVYANNGVIVTSDREKKKDTAYGLGAYGAFFDGLRPVSYRLKDGESGRTHLGLIAQDVEQALAECGLTDMDFAGLIRSSREDGGHDYALRYGEFIPMCIGQIQQLKARVAEMERRLAT